MRSAFGRYAMSGVQSVPRVMRGSPVARGSIVDVPLSQRDLAGLESQGLARTLGSLGGCTLGAEIEMPEECVRPGEVLLSPGVCGPKPQPVNPYATPSQLTSTNVKLTTKAPAAAVAKPVAFGLSAKTLLMGAAAVGLVFYLTKKR